MYQISSGIGTNFFMYVGILATTYIAWKFLSSFFGVFLKYFLAKKLSLSMNLKKAGSWAVVTGSTDGIGKAYAEQLAQRGLNIVLISRTVSKLEAVAKDIAARYDVKTKQIAVDFTQTNIYGAIKSELDHLDVGVLVNNVGVGYDYPEYYLNLPDRDEFTVNMLHCNCLSGAMMTSIVLPRMVAKRAGVIINIGSASGISPVPMMSLYSACKAFVDFFSRALHAEYKSKGITIQSVMPYFVATKMTRMKSSLVVPSPSQYAESALNTLGLETRTFGCFMHVFQDFILSIIPSPLIMYVMRRGRARALRKKKAAPTKSE